MVSPKFNYVNKISLLLGEEQSVQSEFLTIISILAEIDATWIYIFHILKT